MALVPTAQAGIGPLEMREAWPQIAAAYDPLVPFIEHWFALTAAADEDIRARRLDALARCVELCRRTFEHRAQGKPSRDLEHTRSVEAALMRLRATGSTLEPAGILAFGERARALLRAMPGRMALMQPECPRALASLPLPGQPGRLRTQLASQAKSQPHPVMRRVEFAAYLQAWVDLTFERTGRWIDLGSADGQSLVAQAKCAKARETVGVDVAWSFSIASANRLATGIESLPQGVRYLLLGQGGGLEGLAVERVAVTKEEQSLPDRLAARTVAILGAGGAQVVSLLYPIHMPQRGSDGVLRPALEFQLATAVKLLEPGGTGVLVTEDLRAWKHAVVALMRNPAVETVLYGAEAFGREQLESLGVHPYAPTMGELDPSLTTRESIEAPGVPFAWGLPLLFTTRA